MERTTLNSLAKTPAQKVLVEILVDFRLLSKLIKNQMTPDDWSDYTARRKSILRLADRLSPLTVPGQTPEGVAEDLSLLLKPFEDFCARALDRNEAMVSRLLDQMSRDHKKAAVLLAGGFHSKGVTNLLRARNVSYVVLTPKVEHLTPEKNYIDVFAHDPLPLEQVFAGDPLFLLTERGLADRSPHLIADLFTAATAAVLSQEARRLEEQGEKSILPRLQTIMAGYIRTIGPRLKTLSPRVVDYKNGELTCLFNIESERFRLTVSPRGNVTSSPVPNGWAQFFQYAKPKRELGAAGLWGSKNLLRVVFFETTVLAVLSLFGIAHFGLAPTGLNIWEGILNVIVPIGFPLFVTLYLMHFFTGVLQPDGTVLKWQPRGSASWNRSELIEHSSRSFRASLTAARSFIMLPFFVGASVWVWASVWGMPVLIVIGYLLGIIAHDRPNRKIVRQWENEIYNLGFQSVPMVQPLRLSQRNSSELDNLPKEIKEMSHSNGGQVGFNFNTQTRLIVVTMNPPDRENEFKLYVDELKNNLPPIEFDDFKRYADKLAPAREGEVRELITLARKDPTIRTLLAHWALEEMQLAVGSGRSDLWSTPPNRMDEYMTQNQLGYGDPANWVIGREYLESREGIRLGRLVRAGQKTAILRAAGYSLSNPRDQSEKVEDAQEKDIRILLGAWGIAGEKNYDVIEFPYNETLQIAATMDLWSSVAGSFHQPDSKTPSTVYFDVDPIISADGNSQLAYEALCLLLNLKWENKVKKIVLVKSRNIDEDESPQATEWQDRWRQNFYAFTDFNRLKIIEREPATPWTQTPKDGESIEWWTYPPETQRNANETSRVVNVLAIGERVDAVVNKTKFLEILEPESSDFGSASRNTLFKDEDGYYKTEGSPPPPLDGFGHWGPVLEALKRQIRRVLLRGRPLPQGGRNEMSIEGQASEQLKRLKALRTQA